ncbi:hypothetical protein Tco_0786559 [Tanacetum coccineum]
MGCYLTSWFSKKQTALTISRTEAEYVSAGKACQQALWMKQALVDYGVRLDDIPTMCDNKWAIDLNIVMSSDEALSGVLTHPYRVITSSRLTQSRHRFHRITYQDQSFLEYLAPSNTEVPIEDQPHVTHASPTSLSSGYIADSDSEEDPEEDPEDESEDGPMDYPVDGGDNDDDESSGDDVDDENKDEASKEEEEHLALADSTVVPLAVDLAHIPFPSEAEVARLLTIPTPPLSPITPLSSPLPQIPSPPVPVPSPPTTSPTYAEAPLGFKAAGIRLRAASPPPSPTSPPTHHPLPLPAPSTSHGSTLAYRVDYSFVDTLDASIRALERRTMAAIEMVNLRVSYQAQAYRHEWQRQDTDDHATRAIMRIQELEDGARVDTLEDTGSSA